MKMMCTGKHLSAFLSKRANDELWVGDRSVIDGVMLKVYVSSTTLAQIEQFGPVFGFVIVRYSACKAEVSCGPCISQSFNHEALEEI